MRVEDVAGKSLVYLVCHSASTKQVSLEIAHMHDIDIAFLCQPE